VNPHQLLARNLDHVFAFVLQYERLREKLPYEIDGVVIKVNSMHTQQKLGFTAKAPRWAIAYKFTARSGTTQIKDILVLVGRTGKLTPVAVFRPVPIGGITVTRATLHNQNEIERLGVRIGDWVVVERGGDVIPKVVKVIEDKNHPRGHKVFQMPIRCPICHSHVVHVAGEADHHCVNVNCPARLRESILHLSSRSVMNIDGMGEFLVNHLVDAGLVKDIADIYELTREKLLTLERIGDKSAENLPHQIEQSRKLPLERVIYGLGIRFVGERTAQYLAEHFGSIDALRKASIKKLQDANDVGPHIAESIHAFFAEPRNRRLVERLRKYLNFTANKKKRRTALAGKTFVITGTLANYSREAAKKLIEDAGGRVSSAVSRKTDYVLVGDDPGSNLNRARNFGISVIHGKQMEALVTDDSAENLKLGIENTVRNGAAPLRYQSSNFVHVR